MGGSIVQASADIGYDVFASEAGPAEARALDARRPIAPSSPTSDVAWLLIDQFLKSVDDGRPECRQACNPTVIASEFRLSGATRHGSVTSWSIAVMKWPSTLRGGIRKPGDNYWIGYPKTETGCSTPAHRIGHIQIAGALKQMFEHE
jgi:hypothetical protein